MINTCADVLVVEDTVAFLRRTSENMHRVAEKVRNPDQSRWYREEIFEAQL